MSSKGGFLIFLFFPSNSGDFTIFYFILAIAPPVGMIFASIYCYKGHIEKYMPKRSIKQGGSQCTRDLLPYCLPLVHPPEIPRKNGDSVFHTSSASLASFNAFMVASITRKSFSFSEFSITSMRLRQLFSGYFSGKKN